VGRKKLFAIVAALVVVPVVLIVAFVAFRGGSTETEVASADAAQMNPHPVAGSFKPDDTELETCQDGTCYEQAFGNLSFKDGPKAALTLFAEKIASDPGIESNCHRIAHNIGSAALARYEGDVGQAFAEGDSTCWSGYYHGILERALIDVRSNNQLVAAARNLCVGDTVKSTTFLYYQCVHGIGHGLMIHTGLDLSGSLKVCEKLKTDWDQTSCDGGVFMENFNTSYGVRSKFLRDDDPVYPCNAVAERHKLYCYLQITDRLLQVSSYDWTFAAEKCAGVERNWRSTCFQSYGRSASGVSRQDQGMLIAYCNVPDPRWRPDCIYGSVRDIVSQDAGGDRAAKYCRAVATSLRERCVEGAGTILSNLAATTDEFRAACERLTTTFLAACLRQGV